jgi:hypothetical protein
MAQTDARPGFRLPWSSDRQSSEDTDGEQTTDQQAEAGAWPSEDDTTPVAGPAVNVASGEAVSDPQAGSSASPAEAPVASAPLPPKPEKKQTKFMADLTKAMQAAAEDARARALTQLQADAKTHVETIHGRSATEAANLRRGADDDVAAVREWSKAEIARVREETEAKITDRKSRLESEIQQHGGVIEREIDAVQKTVAEFEEEMTAFFERLLGEQDPSRFATMAENLPEAPAFEDIVGGPAPVEAEPEPLEAVILAPAVEPATEPENVATEAETAEAAAETTDQTSGSSESSDSVAGKDGDGELDREAAFAAIQAAAEAAASAEVAASAAARAEAATDVAIEIMANQEDEAEVDPRFAALGLSPDFDAAEAEALAAAGSSDEEIPEIGDDALAARIAGLVPGKTKGNGADSAATQVVVVGLVSVASIASFKRHLGRLPGVQSVGVSSGPEGEFLFAVNHSADTVLRDAIPALPSFQARVTGSSDGVVNVTAHDPESDT